MFQHIAKSAFRAKEYTALAGTAETLTRYRIIKRRDGWDAIPLHPMTTTRDTNKTAFSMTTLRALDKLFVSLSS